MLKKARPKQVRRLILVLFPVILFAGVFHSLIRVPNATNVPAKISFSESTRSSLVITPETKIESAREHESEVDSSENADGDLSDPIVSPDLVVLRKEVEQDVHGIPPSLLELVPRMTRLMEAGLRSEVNAGKAFSLLEECVSDRAESHLIQVRLLCLMNAKRLAKKYDRKLSARMNELAISEPDLYRLTVTSPTELDEDNRE